MYLHIGKEKMINRKDIIFILDYKGLKDLMNFLKT